MVASIEVVVEVELPDDREGRTAADGRQSPGTELAGNELPLPLMMMLTGQDGHELLVVAVEEEEVLVTVVVPVVVAFFRDPTWLKMVVLVVLVEKRSKLLV